MSETWIKETLGLISDLQKRLDQIDDEISALSNEKEEIEQQIMTADGLIRLYRNKYKDLAIPVMDVSPGYFSNKSYPEILADIATKSNNYLRVMDAVEIMLRTGVSDNKRLLQANIYSTLRRMTRANLFQKIKDGEYRYINGLQRPFVLTDKKRTNSKTISKSGVRQVIKDLKEHNPLLTKKEVLSYLIQIGFDFKGKKPVNAVNIVWANLGYSKEGKQQALPDVIMENNNHRKIAIDVKSLPSSGG